MPQGGGFGQMGGVAQRTRPVQQQPGVRLQNRRQGGDQRLGVRSVVLCGQTSLRRLAPHRVKPCDLAGGGLILAPGQALEAGPFLFRRRKAAPSAQEPGFCRGIVNGVHPSPARQRVGIGGTAGVGGCLSAAQHGDGQAGRNALALRQYGGIVGVCRNSFLTAAFKQALSRPVRVALHEQRYFLGRGGARCPQAQIQHEFFCCRVGKTGRIGLRVGPSVRVHRSHRVAFLRPGPGGRQKNKAGED